jgi:hypothetical protein
MENLATGLIYTLIGVGTEVVTLGLDHVGGQPAAPIAIIKGQGTGHGWHGHT